MCKPQHLNLWLDERENHCSPDIDPLGSWRQSVGRGAQQVLEGFLAGGNQTPDFEIVFGNLELIFDDNVRVRLFTEQSECGLVQIKSGGR